MRSWALTWVLTWHLRHCSAQGGGDPVSCSLSFLLDLSQCTQVQVLEREQKCAGQQSAGPRGTTFGAALSGVGPARGAELHHGEVGIRYTTTRHQWHDRCVPKCGFLHATAPYPHILHGKCCVLLFGKGIPRRSRPLPGVPLLLYYSKTCSGCPTLVRCRTRAVYCYPGRASP